MGWGSATAPSANPSRGSRPGSKRRWATPQRPQRPPGSAPVVQGVAEDLPLGDDSFDAAMAIITIHHWNDVPAGLAEMKRVARRQVAILTFDPAPVQELWLVREYFPSALDYHASAMPPSSCWHQMPQDEIERGLTQLEADLESGRWDERNGHLRSLPELDVGLRLVTAELDQA
ncbi:MAG: methyltransferase domain-containing protein [Solirubrobacterales bacterium]